MAGKKKKEQAVEPVTTPILLEGWARGSSFALGLVGACLGTLAVFKSENQAGTVGLIAVAAALLLMGLVGRIPERGDVGKYRYAFAPRTEAKLDSPDQEEREEAADEVLEEGERLYEHLDREAQLIIRANRIVRERTYIELIEAIAELMGFDVKVEPSYRLEGRVLRPDLVVAPGEGRTDIFKPFPVEFKTTLDSQAAIQAARYARAMGSPVALVIGSQPSSTIARPRDVTVDGVRVLVAATADGEGLGNSISAALRHGVAEAMRAGGQRLARCEIADTPLTSGFDYILCQLVCHHLHHWADGGDTAMDNLALLCGRHHTVVHRDRLHGAVDGTGGVVWDRRPDSYDRWLALVRTERDAS